MAIFGIKPATFQPATDSPAAPEHAQRVKNELRAAGATRMGMTKFALHHLPQIIHPSEHVQGVIYGRYSSGIKSLGFDEGTLVATDRRLIFLDYKPGFTNQEEITYDVVSGIQRTTGLFFSGLTLHTRIGDYSFRYVNTKCASRFAEYIEQRRLESEEIVTSQSRAPAPTPNDPIELPAPHLAAPLDSQSSTFLGTHDTGVLSTVGRAGQINGAAVHYVLGADGNVFILTKSDTAKAHNITAHHQVALTVFDIDAMQTVQLEGAAEIESGRRTKNWVWRTATTPRMYGGIKHLPPVSGLQAGAFQVIRITPGAARFSDYKT